MRGTHLWRASILSAVILLSSSSSRSELSDGAAGALVAGEPWVNQPMSRPKTNRAEVPSRYLSRTRTRHGVSKGTAIMFSLAKINP